MTEDFSALGGYRAGSLVAGYRLEAQVGSGGMVVVFRARDQRLGRLVALKILAPALATDDDFRRRFIAESRAAAAVDDPYIIPVYEAGEAEGVLFIAMRFVAGGDLRQVLVREGPLPPGRAAAFISPVASALDAAHRAGLVHRDVKPANILVDAHEDRPDHVYLSDFGVSKGAMTSVSVTGTGQFLGTPDYSAPEQVQGLALDGRADQYALACVAWQLLTGSAPFERDQGLAVLLAHLSAPPPQLTSRRPDLPEAADRVLARALAKTPEERYGSCRDFAEALRDALGVAPYTSGGWAYTPSHPATEIATPQPVIDKAAVAASETIDAVPRGPARTDDAPPPPPAVAQSGGPTSENTQPGRNSQRRVLAITLTCVLLVAAGVTAFLLAVPGSPGSPPGQHSPSSPGHVKVATKGLATALPDPDGSSVGSVAFSPSGAVLATSDNSGHIYLWNVATKRIATTLTDPSSNGVHSVAFSPNGALLAAGDLNGNVYVWNVATKSLAATLPVWPGADGSTYGVDAVAFSPDGATVAASNNNGNATLWNVAAKRRTATFSTADFSPDSLAFSPNGSVLAAGGSAAGTTGTVAGSSVVWNVASGSMASNFTDSASDNVDSVAFSPNGELVAVADTNGDVLLWNFATGSMTPTIPSGAGDAADSVAFSANGGLLAVGDTNGSTYLWNVATKSLAATLADIDGRPADSVAFSPRAATLAVGESNGTTYLWDTARY